MVSLTHASQVIHAILVKLSDTRTVQGARTYQLVSSSMNPTRRGTTVYSLRPKKRDGR